MDEIEEIAVWDKLEEDGERMHGDAEDLHNVRVCEDALEKKGCAELGRGKKAEGGTERARM